MYELYTHDTLGPGNVTRCVDELCIYFRDTHMCSKSKLIFARQGKKTAVVVAGSDSAVRVRVCVCVRSVSRHPVV